MHQRGRTDTGLEHLRAATAAAPAQSWTWMALANVLRAARHLDEAEAAYGRVLDIKPDHPGALAGLGELMLQRGRTGTAIEHLRAATAAGPTQPWNWLSLATALRAAGRLDEAEAACRHALDLKPDLAAALNLLGHILRQLDRDAEATALFRAAIEAEPANPDRRVTLAHVLRETNHLDEAESAYRAALDLRPDHPAALAGLGHILRQLGRAEEAIGFLRAAIAAEPANPDRRIALAQLLCETRHFDAAEAAYRAVLDLKPGHPLAFVGLGIVARQLADRQGALRMFEAAHAADPESVPAASELAAELRDHGQFDRARALLQDMLRKDPANLHAWRNLGMIERQLGRHEAALAAFQAACEHNPSSLQPWIDVATEAFELGHDDLATACLERASALDPEHPAVLGRLVEQALAMEDWAAALSAAQQAASLHPNHLQFRLQLARATAAVSTAQATLRVLDAAEAEFGPMPEIMSLRLNYLRQFGLHAELVAAVSRVRGADIRNFGIWMHCVRFDIDEGDFEGAARALAKPPTTGSSLEAAQIHFLRAGLAQAQWRIDAAAAEYAAGLALHDHLPDPHMQMARTSLLRLDAAATLHHLAEYIRLHAPNRRRKGISLNVSQTHIGHILNEYMIDQQIVAELRPLQAITPQARIQPLIRLLREAPDSTATAASLMLALRHAGMFDRSSAPEPPLADPSGMRARIPPMIVQYWNTAEVPQDVAALMETWRTHHPQFRYERFDDSTAAQFLATRFEPEVLAAFRRCPEPAQRADLFRLAWLCINGGFYADSDDCCIAPLDRIVPKSAEFVCYQEEYATIGNNFLGCVREHPFMRRALALAVAAINRGDSDTIWLSTGPGLVTRAIAQVMAQDPHKLADWCCTIRMLERWEMRQSVATHCAVNYKKTEKSWLRAAFEKKSTRPRRPGASIPAIASS